MIIRETIHHGDFFHERRIGRLGFGAREALTELGQTSPYPFRFDPEHNRHHARALGEFERTGQCAIGWARFQQEPDR